ncbi:MAG: diguanylate cyclase [Lachnospiraceae bacterium]|nr:diguanylate cyclase [Ruminococcus sp.]MCM1274879.1 diguanylate cyclase [Lachnospiraceae bacterium]
MKNFCIFVDAVNFIEDNLCGDFSQEDAAAACCCSLSALQKVWRCCTHTSLKEYIAKRRLTKCAEDIAHTDMTLTDIAMKYQYNSPEVFTRAFRKLWGVSPSKFRTEWHSTGIFPRIIPDESTFKGGIFMGRRVDITELYNELRPTDHDVWVLCFDIVNFMQVNEDVGRDAGDVVIREAFHRVDAAAGDSMAAFRIGGDEFAVVTGTDDKTAAEQTAQKVISLNGQPVVVNGREIPLTMRVGAVKLSAGVHGMRFSELFDRMQNAINETRSAGQIIFFND